MALDPKYPVRSGIDTGSNTQYQTEKNKRMASHSSSNNTNTKKSTKFDSVSFPSENRSKYSAKVSFKSYEWNFNTAPKLSNTVIVSPTQILSDIRLYLPANFSEAYGAEWGNEQLITVANNLNGQGLNASIFETGANILNKAGLDGVLNSTKYQTGETHFPGEFAIFKKGKPITLSFDFDLVPKNVEDAQLIDKIVQNFKYKSSPIFNGGTLQYPDIWQITFIGIKGPGHPQTNGRYEHMVLTNVVPSYIGGEHSALVFEPTEKDSNSYPIGVKLHLDFICVKQNYINFSG